MPTFGIYFDQSFAKYGRSCPMTGRYFDPCPIFFHAVHCDHPEKNSYFKRWWIILHQITCAQYLCWQKTATLIELEELPRTGSHFPWLIQALDKILFHLELPKCGMYFLTMWPVIEAFFLSRLLFPLYLESHNGDPIVQFSVHIFLVRQNYIYIYTIFGVMGQFQHEARFFIFILFCQWPLSGNNPLTIGLCDFLGQPL